MPVTWVVVADGGQAKLFQTHGPLTEMSHVQTIANTHAYGDHRHQIEPDSQHHHLEEGFAMEIAELITKVANENGFQQLVLVADPKFLGRLKNRLDTPVSKRIIGTVNKDYVNLPIHELGQRIQEQLGVPERTA